MSEHLGHLSPGGGFHMVGVSGKRVTHRVARAEGSIRMQAGTLARLEAGDTPKGSVLALAQVAGIMAAKRTFELVPLAHPVPLERVEVTLVPGDGGVRCESTVEATARTGVELEALAAVTGALLTVYDMLKGVERGMEITGVRLLFKAGGRSGTYEARQ